MLRILLTLLFVPIFCGLALPQQVQGQPEEPYDEYVDSPTVVLADRSYPAVRILVDGEETLARGFIRQGRTYLPARETLQRLGGVVLWSPAERAFYAQFAERNRTVRVATGSPTAIVYDYNPNQRFGAGQRIDTVNVGAVPFQAEGMIFVPIRGAAEASGSQIAYDQRTRTVRVTSPPGSRTPAGG